MANVAVEKIAVSQAIRLCQEMQNELKNSRKSLQNQYRAAGSTWKDEKYQQLGRIVDECSGAMERPERELTETMNKLGKLLLAIERYEDQNLV